MKPLVVIPNYVTKDGDVEVVGTTLASIRRTVSDSVDVMLVDDCSPRPELVEAIRQEYGRYDFELIRKEENTGFSRTVNIGLKRARDEGREAVLLNADMELSTPGWVNRCRKTTGSKGQPAALVGALLLYPNGLIQHAGIYFSLLTRTFDHLYRYSPGNLPDALKKKVCPVTGAFQFIRPAVLEDVGLYDEAFFMGWEDVDYCIRVFNAGMECVYNPNIRAYHYESMFRGGERADSKVKEWQARSFVLLCNKYATQSFAGLVPNW